MTWPQLISALIFLLTLLVVLSERVHRTTAALVGAAAMILAGTAMHFYTQEDAVRAIDFNTLGLLLGMMIMVQLLEKTGFFQYLAIVTGKRSKGQPWLLLLMLGTTTTFLSMVLDNVTTIILIAPITILIADILGITPAPLLLGEALLSNIGGVATLIGDPPNVIIGSASGLSFVDFLTHLAPLVLVAWLVSLAALRFLFRADLARRPKDIQALNDLDEREALHDQTGVRRMLIILGGVILLFFLHDRFHLLPATIAIGGAAVALLWTRADIEETFRHVEWSVLLFFLALFMVVGGLEASGTLTLLAAGIGQLARENLMAASQSMLWLAAIISAVVDNIPFTIAVVPLISNLEQLGITVSPLWWALALGAGFGGNGTPLGSTAGVITVSMSEKTRYPISMRTWLKYGLPVMIITCVIASVWFFLFFEWMKTP